ncbi:MAG: hypothetical protein R3250_17420 [Melioribacteraceae bacterium]|nr:hypothetical protein [Melioribacteraceae bacterium]
MRYAVLILSLFFLCTAAQGTDEVEFRDWYGVYGDDGRKYIATFSGESGTELRVFIDNQNIHRLKFEPARKIKLAKFDHRQYRSMNFNSLYGYDHWIRKMKKHYRLQVWFEGEKRSEEFSLKGFYKAERWLFK